MAYNGDKWHMELWDMGYYTVNEREANGGTL